MSAFPALLLIATTLAAAAVGLRFWRRGRAMFGSAAVPVRATIDARRLRVPPGDGRVATVAIVAVERLDALSQRVGHALAGEVVDAVARRIAELWPDAVFGRVGRTTIDIGFLAAPEAVATTLDTLMAALEAPLAVGDAVLDLSLRTGFAEIEMPGDAIAVERAIEHAEVALADARAQRRRRLRFDPAEEAERTARRQLMRDLRGAVGRDEMHLCYQPKFRSRTERIDAVEALLRWEHPEHGLVPPDTFIPLAEENGEIRTLTDWVLARALADQRRLAEAGFQLTIHINISGRLIADRAFAERALAAVAQAEGTIGFEITETAVIDDPVGALANLEAFVAAGIRIAIDDYGSGLSSLAYLKRLPAHELKIDKQFVSNLTDSHRDPLLIRSTIDLAHALEMEVTAEGVEVAAAMALLRVMGCDLIQGYLISRPLRYEALVPFLQQHRAAAQRGRAAPLPTAASWWRKARG